MTAMNYRVRVSGMIPNDLLEELPGMTISVEAPETVLFGELPDQSAMFVLISRMHGMGLRLIEIRRLGTGHE